MKLSTDEKALCDVQCKFPLEFCAPFFFGDPREKCDENLGNGTLSLLEIDGNKLGITCKHVIDGYREEKAQNTDLQCYIGDALINPEELLISENKELDICVFDLTDISSGNITTHGEIKSNFFRRDGEWPCPKLHELKEGDFLIFGGYPGIRRDRKNMQWIEFGSDSTGGARITSVSEELIRCEYDKEKAYISYDEDGKAFMKPGGMSGGPAFICWPEAIAKYSFVGIIKNGLSYEGDYGVFEILPASFLKADGTISA